MKNFASKLASKFTSRKFLLALLGDIMGIVTMIVGQNLTTTIIGAAAVIVINVVYCIVEGVVDAKSVAQIADSAVIIADELGAPDEVVDAIDKVGDVVEDIVGDGGDPPVEGE